MHWHVPFIILEKKMFHFHLIELWFVDVHILLAIVRRRAKKPSVHHWFENFISRWWSSDQKIPFFGRHPGWFAVANCCHFWLGHYMCPIFGHIPSIIKKYHLGFGGSTRGHSFTTIRLHVAFRLNNELIRITSLASTTTYTWLQSHDMPRQRVSLSREKNMVRFFPVTLIVSNWVFFVKKLGRWKGDLHLPLLLSKRAYFSKSMVGGWHSLRCPTTNQRGKVKEMNMTCPKLSPQKETCRNSIYSPQSGSFRYLKIFADGFQESLLNFFPGFVPWQIGSSHFVNHLNQPLAPPESSERWRLKKIWNRRLGWNSTLDDCE